MKIALYGQYYKDSTENIMRRLMGVLAKHTDNVFIEAGFAAALTEKGLLSRPYPVFATHGELDDTDVFISVGGDGTMLRAATYVRDKNIPILGINTGRLGFLATVQEESIEQLVPLIFQKQYKISKRSLLQLDFDNAAFASEINFAMNEITVSRKDTTSMITIDTQLDGEHLNAYWADGLIISTPTGSTGYSLSCGGPVLLPEVNSLVITPIAPHNLSARPLVIPDDTAIELTVSSREQQHLVSLDSRIISVDVETKLRISKAPFTISLIEFPEEKFLDTLRKKLLWGEDKRN